jgi:uncharacterized protein YdcH (DUF465 family)
MEHSEELKAHLLATDSAYRQLAHDHAELDRQLAALEGKEHFTPADEDLEHEIKKQKLRLKDQMNELLSKAKAQHV